jgi:hypothetical protein
MSPLKFIANQESLSAPGAMLRYLLRSRNRATVLVQALLEQDAEIAAQKLIDAAKEGDLNAALSGHDPIKYWRAHVKDAEEQFYPRLPGESLPECYARTEPGEGWILIRCVPGQPGVLHARVRRNT